MSLTLGGHIGNYESTSIPPP